MDRIISMGLFWQIFTDIVWPVMTFVVGAFFIFLGGFIGTRNRITTRQIAIAGILLAIGLTLVMTFAGTLVLRMDYKYHPGGHIELEPRWETK